MFTLLSVKKVHSVKLFLHDRSLISCMWKESNRVHTQIIMRIYTASPGHFPYVDLSNDSASGQGRPWSDCALAQADQGLRFSHMR